MKILPTTVGFLLICWGMASAAEEEALDEALKKRATLALTAQSRLARPEIQAALLSTLSLSFIL